MMTLALEALTGPERCLNKVKGTVAACHYLTWKVTACLGWSQSAASPIQTACLGWSQSAAVMMMMGVLQQRRLEGCMQITMSSSSCVAVTCMNTQDQLLLRYGLVDAGMCYIC